ncbi:uncharacterized protein BDV17DRAFT_254320 [Aspergillus undulatus]|uniref:uncharacterized protein n=1 Tax=Aspergillus undulatus TaxID=1810928 RepID=UPI003CCCEFD4
MACICGLPMSTISKLIDCGLWPFETSHQKRIAAALTVWARPNGGYHGVIRLLLDTAEGRIRTDHKGGYFPIHIAANSGAIGTVRMLLQDLGIYVTMAILYTDFLERLEPLP